MRANDIPVALRQVILDLRITVMAAIDRVCKRLRPLMTRW